MGVAEPLYESGSVSLAPPSLSSRAAAPSTSGGASISLAPEQPGQMPSATAVKPAATSAALPPFAGLAAAGMAQAALQQATAGSGAGQLLQKGAETLTLHVQANPRSITVMSFVGGLVLAFVSFLNILNLLNIFNPLNWILQLYQFAAGVVIIVIDGPSEKLPGFFRDRLQQSAAFLLHSNTNRVLFYLFIACQQGTQAGLFNWIVGWYFAFIAIGFAAVRAAPPKASNDDESQHLPVV